MTKRRLFRHVQIQSPDWLRALCGLLQAIEGVLRFVTLGIVSVWFSAGVSLTILRRDVNRSRAKRRLPPYKPFQKRHPITEEVMPGPDEFFEMNKEEEKEVLDRGYF